LIELKLIYKIIRYLNIFKMHSKINFDSNNLTEDYELVMEENLLASSSSSKKEKKN